MVLQPFRHLFGPSCEVAMVRLANLNRVIVGKGCKLLQDNTSLTAPLAGYHASWVIFFFSFFCSLLITKYITISLRLLLRVQKTPMQPWESQQRPVHHHYRGRIPRLLWKLSYEHNFKLMQTSTCCMSFICCFWWNKVYLIIIGNYPSPIIGISCGFWGEAVLSASQYGILLSYYGT